MTWEETIQYIRTLPEFSDLVKQAYFDEDLELNVSRFGKSDEFNETLNIINTHTKQATLILDIGCGNGISAINFALKGFEVTAVEPDKSDTVGAGAIQLLKTKLQLQNINIYTEFAEQIKFPDNHFDIVYVRQAMHHANDLQQFLKECVRVLKPNGLLLTIRDHVIYDEADKQLFLNAHPLQKYYGGENAYTSKEYKEAITSSGAKLIKELKYYDSVLNFFPQTKEDIVVLKHNNDIKQQNKLKQKLGVIGNHKLIWRLYCLMSKYEGLNEAFIPGRMYSYIAKKS